MEQKKANQKDDQKIPIEAQKMLEHSRKCLKCRQRQNIIRPPGIGLSPLKRKQVLYNVQKRRPRSRRVLSDAYARFFEEFLRPHLHKIDTMNFEESMALIDEGEEAWINLTDEERHRYCYPKDL